MRGTGSTLGLGASAGGPVNDTDLTYDSNWFHTTARGYGDDNDDTPPPIANRTAITLHA